MTGFSKKVYEAETATINHKTILLNIISESANLFNNKILVYIILLACIL